VPEKTPTAAAAQQRPQAEEPAIATDPLPAYSRFDEIEAAAKRAFEVKRMERERKDVLETKVCTHVLISMSHIMTLLERI
jgi:hypothetical protein